jgi:Coenzyme PQQ synthesis protein D (PqqD)
LDKTEMTEKYIAKSSAIASRLLGGEMMVMSAVDSTFFTLNPVATVIWQAADGRTPLSDIVTHRVCAEFEVDPEVARRDVERFVEELSSHGILLVSEHPIPAASPEAA